MTNNYWTRKSAKQALQRRSFLQAGGASAVGLAALGLTGCGGDDDDDAASTPSSGGSTPAAGETPSATQETGAPVSGGTMRTGVGISVLGMDPHIESSVSLRNIAKIYSSLITYNPATNEIGPRLSAVPEQPTPTEYVFKINPAAKFQNIAPVNGRNVTADDVKYSFERLRDLPQSTRGVFFKTQVDKMEVLDEQTFKLTTKTPYVETFSELGLGGGLGPSTQVVAREDVEARGDLSNGGIGSGPYILDRYSKGEITALRRNPDYWETPGVPYPDRWEEQTISDPQVLLQAFITDQLDINGAALNKLDADDLARNENVVTTKIKSLSNGCFELDVSRPPFNDPRVRQAIKIGLDRSQFIDKLFYGEATAAGAFSSGLELWALPQDELQPFVKHDPQKAKELLAAAGYEDGFDLEIISSGVSSYQNYAEIVVAELKKLGINAQQSIYDIGVFVSQYMYVGNFPSAVWVTNGYPTLVTPLNYYHKNGLGSGNWWHYENEEVSALIDRQYTEFETATRQETVLEIQRKVLSDWAPHIPLVDGTDYAAYNKRVKGYDPLQRSYQLLRYSEYLEG